MFLRIKFEYSLSGSHHQGSCSRTVLAFFLQKIAECEFRHCNLASFIVSVGFGMQYEWSCREGLPLRQSRECSESWSAVAKPIHMSCMTR